MKILKYFIVIFFYVNEKSQEIMKGGEKPTTFTYDEKLEMLKNRDAEWEEKIEKI